MFLIKTSGKWEKNVDSEYSLTKFLLPPKMSFLALQYPVTANMQLLDLKTLKDSSASENIDLQI